MASVDIEALNEQVLADSEVIDRIRKETAKVIVGQQYMVDRLLLGLLSKGHILLEGLPGLAKTLAINTNATLVAIMTPTRLKCKVGGGARCVWGLGEFANWKTCACSVGLVWLV